MNASIDLFEMEPVFSCISIQRIDRSIFDLEEFDAGVAIKDLPIEVIDLRETDPSEVSILSWRWDAQVTEGRSRNIWSAVRFARDNNIKYVLIDKLSIDQNLGPPRLIERVSEFTKLFSIVPVVASYDIAADWTAHLPTARYMRPRDAPPGEAELHNKAVRDSYRRWRRHLTLARPWIFHEMRRMATNPKSVTYVGNAKRLHCPWEQYTGVGPSFEEELAGVRSANIGFNCLSVLYDRHLMYDISDFRFLIPQYHDELVASHRMLTSEDFLLLSTLLCYSDHVWEREHKARLVYGEHAYGAKVELEPERFDFVRFSFDSVDPDAHIDKKAKILFDSELIGYWRHQEGLPGKGDRRWIETLPNFPLSVWRSLGLLEAGGVGHGARPKPDFLVKKNAAWPDVHEYGFSFDSGQWVRMEQAQGYNEGELSRLRGLRHSHRSSEAGSGTEG